MKNFLYPLLLSLLISSCNKPKFDEDYVCLENCVVFSGKIIDTPFNNNLSGVELKFYFHPLEGSSFLRPPIYLGTKTTGENGTYRFEFNGGEYKKAGYFTIEGKKEGYFSHPYETGHYQHYESVPVEEIQYKTPIERNIALYKNAILELKVRSKNPLEYETFHVNYGTVKHENGVFNQSQGYTTGFNIPFHEKIDTIIPINIPVGIKSFIQWQGGNYLKIPVVSGTDSLISRTGEKVFYEIEL